MSHGGGPQKDLGRNLGLALSNASVQNRTANVFICDLKVSLGECLTSPGVNPGVLKGRLAFFADWCGRLQQPIANPCRLLSFPLCIRHPRQTPAVTCTQGSFKQQGVSTSWVRHSLVP